MRLRPKGVGRADLAPPVLNVNSSRLPTLDLSRRSNSDPSQLYIIRVTCNREYDVPCWLLAGPGNELDELEGASGWRSVGEPAFGG